MADEPATEMNEPAAAEQAETEPELESETGDTATAEDDQESSATEGEEAVVEKENDGDDLPDVPEDIWSIHRAGLGQDKKGVIRFAEDIEDLGGGVTARKGRRNTTQPNISRNKRGKGSRKR